MQPTSAAAELFFITRSGIFIVKWLADTLVVMHDAVRFQRRMSVAPDSFQFVVKIGRITKAASVLIKHSQFVWLKPCVQKKPRGKQLGLKF